MGYKIVKSVLSDTSWYLSQNEVVICNIFLEDADFLVYPTVDVYDIGQLIEIVSAVSKLGNESELYG